MEQSAKQFIQDCKLMATLSQPDKFFFRQDYLEQHEKNTGKKLTHEQVIKDSAETLGRMLECAKRMPPKELGRAVRMKTRYFQRELKREIDKILIENKAI